MKRRTFLASTIGVCVGLILHRRLHSTGDQLNRIRELVDRIPFRWGGNSRKSASYHWRPRLQCVPSSESMDKSAINVYCDGLFRSSEGKMPVAVTAIKQRDARRLSDEDLVAKLSNGLLRSAAERHQVGMFDIDPPPTWVTA